MLRKLLLGNVTLLPGAVKERAEAVLHELPICAGQALLTHESKGMKWARGVGSSLLDRLVGVRYP